MDAKICRFCLTGVGESLTGVGEQPASSAHLIDASVETEQRQDQIAQVTSVQAHVGLSE